ncbi:Protein phosphatase 2C 6 [Ophidiomyces ophidiicola]|uniref:Protein phosphatase 2C 6 n=1 Tax=Ophidiomyces ophidiicola TaxID=1387563 RepID=UPI0020C4EBDC|nr:Protein phosphatase 2C 6 [Ophidiomyces ophidiicola]KAI1940283.1 Protein phosphatase 2C 6 [Ophidiomyces ophidiicola]KAI2012171.1 Protein phosphatase 2C 6 [Ophidiomyces ophidiicola]KAI2056513.1 Protein phosphatase 2C 6 [Ophidiomyces ophidiicola]KAI2136402.1 Protein phosphatase 2C 6 [Ophidiomyces ophidiicola]KAI2139689.1 Protein phosphatase 2C 6 [Ophidiomyces ophidiicola]
MSTRLVKPARVHAWTLADSYSFIATFLRRQHTDAILSSGPHHQTQQPPSPGKTTGKSPARRYFHDYFVTHLPVSSLHPDSRLSEPLHHLPRSESIPHVSSSKGASPASVLSPVGVSRETTVVRIPLRSAKHHFGVSVSRGSRPRNEDTYQAGVIELPAFAKRPPLSLTIGRRAEDRSSADFPGENRVADNAIGDPQVFYFGVFDGHGGTVCSEFLRDKLHGYVQETAMTFELGSSIRKSTQKSTLPQRPVRDRDAFRESLQAYRNGPYDGNPSFSPSNEGHGGKTLSGDLPILQPGNRQKIGELEKSLVSDWRNLVGGYFRRFKPAHFCYSGENDLHTDGFGPGSHNTGLDMNMGVPIEEVLEYAFLRADYDFISAQASKQDSDSVSAERPLNELDILHNPSRLRPTTVGGATRFKGGSTCSIAMISTPTPAPFWHPSAPSSLVVSHVGDTRVLLCSTASGIAIPLTTDHHPSSPVESNRLRRYATSLVTDSFGEERISGLANSRAFGDIQSKRIGISAEPEIRRVEMGPAEYSFLVLMSDGVSGTLSDQEIVDIVKEAKTPDAGARDVVNLATEVSKDGDNATCLVVRLGGWERRLEGGLGSMGTKESRDWRRQEASDPRGRRT